MTQGRSLADDIYLRPRPEVVAQVWDGYSPEAAYERWGWASPATLAQLAAEGRRLLRARAGEPARLGSRRSTAAEQDAVIVEAVHRHGTLHHASVECGVGIAVVRRVLRERGIPFPQADRGEVARRAAETKRQRRTAA